MSRESLIRIASQVQDALELGDVDRPAALLRLVANNTPHASPEGGEPSPVQLLAELSALVHRNIAQQVGGMRSDDARSQVLLDQFEKSLSEQSHHIAFAVGGA